ncbi:hypothetical protein CYPRO_0172 [Cyclonatronum proteinivorum]|uniref:DUF4139 domain-containing protein n=1 Tax=Cyclonatronum proteinivorum TaxID=1457365 RepID=A0A345UG58_9BACT|nr:hypothetical protein [Cyclonatronum proteinivorum]AXI99459.1 hypothetical protein CYPRO_0172 [Cyclonatronum proteinivorum]
MNNFLHKISLTALLLLTACSAIAQNPAAEPEPGFVFSSKADEVQIRIQGGQFATVWETRILSLQEGTNEVLLHGLPNPANITDLQFAGELLPVGSALRMQSGAMTGLFDRLVDQQVTLTGPAGTISGTVEQVRGSMLSLRDADGHQIIVPNPHQYSLQTTGDSADIRAETGVLLTYNAPRAGSYRIQLWYHTGLLGWTAEHQLLVDAETDQLDWHTFIHLENNTGAAWDGVQLKIESGGVNRRGGMGGLTSQVANDRNPDRFVHAFEDAIDLAPSESQRRLLLKAENIAYEKSYRFQATHNRSLNVTNRRPDILYRIDAGQMLAANNVSGIPHLPPGETRLLLRTGETLTLIGDRELTRAASADTLIRIQGGRSSRLLLDEVVRVLASGQDERLNRIEGTYTVRNLGTQSKPLQISIPTNENTRVLNVTGARYRLTADALEMELEMQPGAVQEITFTYERRP